ncbi:hypothetical protein AB2B38_002855 [Balneola sp. MJW-20]
MRGRVYRHMLRTRGWKYRVFLRQLRLFKYLAFAPTRGAFLENYYTLMRFLDDIVDGDHPLPDGIESAETYISDLILFTRSVREPRDEAEYLLAHCFGLAQKFGEDFTKETCDILESLLFDAQRRGRGKIYPKKELARHFYKLDIRGTIRATLKVFKDDPDKFTDLIPLGTASRYQFDLEDLEEDIRNGYINISREDFERLDMTLNDLYNINSGPMIIWRKEHALEGIRLIEKHHEQLLQNDFSLLERMAFKYVYEKPALKVFNNEIREPGITPI